MIVWSGSDLPSSPTEALALINGVKTAYTGTLTADDSNLAPLLAMTDNADLVKKSNDIITNYLNGDSVTNTGASSYT